MDATTLTQKHLLERIDLEALHETERKNMEKRHRLSSLEAKGKYFQRKRDAEMDNLLAEHKLELSRLFDTHQKEFEQWRSVKAIIRDAKQLSFDLPPKQVPEIKQSQEQMTVAESLKNLLEKVRSKKKQKQRQM